MNYDLKQKFKGMNAYTESFFQLQSFIPMESITRQDLDHHVKGKQKIQHFEQMLNLSKKAFKALRLESIQYHEKISQWMFENLCIRQAQAAEIANNDTDIFKANPSKFTLDNDRKDAINVLKCYKDKLEIYQKKVADLITDFKGLDIGKTEPIDREMFKGEISQFAEITACYIEQVRTFGDQVAQELSKVNDSLEILSQEHRNSGYSITTMLETIWLEDYRKPDVSNQENN